MTVFTCMLPQLLYDRSTRDGAVVYYALPCGNTLRVVNQVTVLYMIPNSPAYYWLQDIAYNQCYWVTVERSRPVPLLENRRHILQLKTRWHTTEFIDIFKISVSEPCVPLCIPSELVEIFRQHVATYFTLTCLSHPRGPVWWRIHTSLPSFLPFHAWTLFGMIVRSSCLKCERKFS